MLIPRCASALLAFAAIASVAPLKAQQISGSILGTVKDSQGGAISGAKVTLKNQERADIRQQNTGTDGAFVFTPVQPGTYSVSIEASGFKKSEQTDLKVFATDRINLGEITLEVGTLTETVTVEASAVQIQSASAERSGVLTTRQIVDIASRERSYLALVRTLPGVVQTGNNIGDIMANGNRGNQNNLLLDGVTNIDTGSNGGQLATANMDMIAEMKVITNSQPAEFGRSSGAQVVVVTKSGTQDFHGTGYWFHRHEGLNANSWRNNQEGRQRPYYRYNTQGFNVGGPVFIPGFFNRNRNKLFFFVGMEWQEQLVPQDLRNVTVPTALERQGDFSRSFEGGGTPVRIIDPLTGQQFPNNMIPQNRINPDGQRILNFYPLPNAVGRSTDYNYQTQFSDTYPRKERIFRGDYNITDKWKTYGRFIKTASETNKNYGQWNADYNIPFAPMNFGDPGWSFVQNVTTIINPTLTNEFVFGSSKNVLNIDPVDDTFNRDKLNLSYRMPYPSADPLGLVQNWRFDGDGGVPNGPWTAFNGTPFRNFNHTWDITNNIAKVWTTHTFKFGIYLHKSQKDQTAFTPANGTIRFNRDTNNPNDANWAFANALLGNYRTLEQSSVVLNGQYRYWNVEWFGQDSWRATSKLTLEYGMRFYYMQPQYDKELQTSSFNPALYDANSTAVLMQPRRNADGTIVAVNPVTGATSPRALIGSLVNTGRGYVNGLYANGMGLAGQNGYPKGLINGSGVLFAPRFGVAYQFIPKTVLRLGAGIFYDRFQGNPVFDMLPNPPSTARPQFWYGNLSSIPPASAGTFFPANVNGFDINGEIPTTYNWNVTLQRELPGAIVADVAYVGSLANHIIFRRNLNAAPLGSAWLPQNHQFDGSTTKQTNLYRPFQGYANTTLIGFGANSNYHSLQMSANRRFFQGLTFGVAYTWSKAMGTLNDDYGTNHPFNTRVADYGPLSFDRTHNLVINYVYDLPRFVRGTSGFAKAMSYVTNNWQLSGLTTFQTGQPDNITFEIDGVGNLNERYTGSADVAPRVVVTGKPNYPKDQYQWIDSSVLALPPLRGSQGFDSAPRMFRRPGDHNWDLNIFKNIPLGAESRRYIQLRCEMYNAFNIVRYSDFQRTVRFNRAGQVINLPSALGGNGGRFGFGSVTSTRDPRYIQLAAKVYF
jgi:hypothetical protein